MTPIPLGGEGGRACGIGELDAWQAMDAYQAAFVGASAEELTGRGGGAYYVRQAAWETVIAQRMGVRAVISIHRALVAGISVGELAHVLGVSHTDVAERWRRWADGQRGLNVQCPGVGLGECEYEQVAAVIGADAAGSGGSETFVGCACQGRDTQIGSPRP